MTNIEVFRLTPGAEAELAQIRRLTAETGVPESPEYIAWKYEQNPYIREPIFYVARAGGRIIGMRGMYGTKWEFGPSRESVVIPCADDFVVVSDHRNSGLMTLIMREALADMARRGHEYVINTSGGRITVMSSLAAGWKSATQLEPMVRRSGKERLRFAARARARRIRGLWRLTRRSGAMITSSPAPFRRIDGMGRVAAGRNAFLTADAAPRAEAMAALVARLPYDGRIRHVRDAGFFAWRYRNPVRQYRFLYHERAGELEGYLVLGRYEKSQLPMLPYHIVDWEGSDDTVRRELLACAARVANAPELGAWATGLANADREHLAHAGFVATDLPIRARGMPCVIVKRIRDDAPPADWMLGTGSILKPERWDMRMIYSMHG